MFERWSDIPGYPTLFRVDREVRVDTSRLFPGSGARQDELPLWLKSGGLRLESWAPARQVAWLRRADGGWLAVLLLEAGSTNQQSTVTMQLWVAPEFITTDLSCGGSANQKPGHRGRSAAPAAPP